MENKKVALLTLSLLATPITFPGASPTIPSSSPVISSQDTPSFRTSVRRMRHQLAEAPVLQSYIQPANAHHIDSPLPSTSDPNQIVGIYGNILYPEDRELLQKQKLFDWIFACEKDLNTPFPLSSEEVNDISLYILDHFVAGTLRQSFIQQVQTYLKDGQSLEKALQNAKQKALDRASLYRDIGQKVPHWQGRCEILATQFIECAQKAETLIADTARALQENPTNWKENKVMQPPFAWDVRTQVFKQMVDKITAVSVGSPYFLALQEVTPQALSDLKKTLQERNLQWISFNNLSGQQTLEPQQESVLGEATAFTTTIALSSDLEVLKVELGDLPTESGSVRKILGVRVRNTHNNEVFNLFTTHTDHHIQNDIYARTATKIHEFATRFFQDATLQEQRFVLGGDFNVFEDAGGDQYIKRLRELFPDSQDFRETDYYAPNPIACSSFIGRSDDLYRAPITQEGTVKPNALDHILVSDGVALQSAAREAGIYDETGQLIDYYQEPDRYMTYLEKRETFSDHFFNIVRFK